MSSRIVAKPDPLLCQAGAEVEVEVEVEVELEVEIAAEVEVALELELAVQLEKTKGGRQQWRWKDGLFSLLLRAS